MKMYTVLIRENLGNGIYTFEYNGVLYRQNFDVVMSGTLALYPRVGFPYKMNEFDFEASSIISQTNENDI